MQHWSNWDFPDAVTTSLGCGYVTRMSDDRIPKMLMDSQLDSGQRTVGRLWLGYKDKLKSNLSAANVPHTNFKQIARDRNNWRYLCRSGMRNFEISCIDWLRDKKQQKVLANINIPVVMSRDLHCCTICRLVGRLLSGLKCHIWQTERLNEVVRSSYIKTHRRVHLMRLYIYIYTRCIKNTFTKMGGGLTAD